MDKRWTRQWNIILLITCYCFLQTHPASAVGRDRRNDNENSPELVSYFRQQYDEHGSSADEHITPLYNDKLTDNKLLSEVELASFMHPAHRPILPSRRRNTSSTSLFTFFNKEQHRAISAKRIKTRPTSEIDGDDEEYESDLEEEKSMLSPLENLPIISNLITGKGLDFHQNEADSAISRMKVTDKDDSGVNVNIKNDNKSTGSIQSLPDNARMDLEDPTQELDLSVEVQHNYNRTEASKRTKNSTSHHQIPQPSNTISNHSSLPSQAYFTALANSTNKNTNKSLPASLNSANFSKTHNNTKQNTSSAGLTSANKISKLDHNPTTVSITKFKPNVTTQSLKHSYMNHTITKDKKPINSAGHIHYQSNKFYLSEPTTKSPAKSPNNPSTTHQLTTNTSKMKNKKLQTHAPHVGSTNRGKSNQTKTQQQQKNNKTKTFHEKINANSQKPFTMIGAEIHQVPVKQHKDNVSQSNSHEILFKSNKGPAKVKGSQERLSYPKNRAKQALLPLTKSNTTESVFKEKEQAQKQYENNNIQFIQLPPSDEARCMDGSSPAYYFRKGYGDGKANWIIHLHGGAWCYDLRSCSKRRNSILGSTKRSLEEDIGGFFHGILSNDHKVNPNFYNWNNVVLTYCDGGLFSGNRDKPLVGKGKTYYFQGRRVLRSQLENIKEKMNLTSGKNIVLSGTSAGGLSLILQANYIRRFLPENAKIRGLVDAGYFLDQDSIFNTSISNVQFKAMYSLHRPTLSRSCVEKQAIGKKFKCLFPHETIKYVKIPLFLVNSLYDHWQLSYLEGISCVYDDNKCDQPQHDRILGFRNKMYTALSEAFKDNNTTGVFANSCFAHGQVILDFTWSKARVNKRTIAEAFYDWYKDDTLTGSKRHVHADCKLPCNGSCPSLLASRCVVNFKKASVERRKRDAELC